MIWNEMTLTSRQNPTVSRYVRLEDRKTREKESLFRFGGVKLFGEALKKHIPIETVLVRLSSREKVEERLHSLYGDLADSTVFTAVEDGLFDRICEEDAPDGILCIARFVPELHAKSNLPEIDSGERILLLESVRDPSNIGAICRSAAALGVNRLVLSADCADLYGEKTLRASMGALFSLPTFRVPDMAEAIGGLRRSGRRVFAAALDRNAVRLGDVPLLGTDTVVIGNEGHGLRLETIAACNGTLFIPMAPNTESLNAAVAASIFLWEMRPR